MERNVALLEQAGTSLLANRMTAIIHGMWRRAEYSLPSDVRDDCELEASLALWQARERLGALPEGQREAYAAVCVRRRISQILRCERRHHARTVSLEALRTEGGTVVDLGEDAASAGEVPASGSLSEQLGCATLAAVVRALPARDQDILNLYYVKELTDVEIAGQLNASAAAVKVRRNRAIGKIRRKLSAAD
jgi:RNA polymerase sigma factor (sigma-70 family)